MFDVEWFELIRVIDDLESEKKKRKSGNFPKSLLSKADYFLQLRFPKLVSHSSL